MPSISVLIPVHNAAFFLNDTIKSVLCQTFTDFELLAMDDDSTDQSAEIIQSFKDARIRYYHCPHDFVGTLNLGLSLAQGEYIALLDHDDIMMPQRLQIQYDFMEKHTDIVACSGYMHSFGRYSKRFLAPLTHDELIRQMIVDNPIWNPTGFIRREILIRHNVRYQTGYSYAADYKFWFEVSKVGRLQTIPKVLTLYRTSTEQASIKYKSESVPACHKIRKEIMDYWLAQLSEKHQSVRSLIQKIMSVINIMNEQRYFEEETFNRFMQEVITGLMKNRTGSPSALVSGGVDMQTQINTNYISFL